MQKERVADNRRDGTEASSTVCACPEVTTDLVIRVEHNNVTEMLQELPTEVMYVITHCFKAKLRGFCDAPSSLGVLYS